MKRKAKQKRRRAGLLRALKRIDRHALEAAVRESRYVPCYRAKTEDRELRFGRVAVHRLMNALQAARYYLRVHGVDVEPATLLEAAVVGDINCRVMLSPAAALAAAKRPRLRGNDPTDSRRYWRLLNRGALRFTRCDLDRSHWLYMERILAQAPAASRAVMAVALRHPPSRVVSAESLAAVTPSEVNSFNQLVSEELEARGLAGGTLH